MDKKECVAMILAGGRGERLGTLTQHYSKPAIHFGGKYRIIDFTLNNCRNSGIDTVGVLSQRFTSDLNLYVQEVYRNGMKRGGVHVLQSEGMEGLYKGTADAVYRNLAFIERFSPEYVLVLASDHVYRMDYRKMIAFHRESGADVTVASTAVLPEEAPRFGILNAGEDGRVLEFEEKPRRPKSNLASMGIYVFKWNVLKEYLLEDNKRAQSKHDFGKDILPEMLSRCRLYSYQFDGYWRDVGTVDKLWEANMDMLDNPSLLRQMESEWDIYEQNADFLSARALIEQSILCGGCSIYGRVKHSVLGNSVTVGQGAEVINSVIMPNAYIGDHVKIRNAIVGTYASISNDTVIGPEHGLDSFVDRQVCAGEVSLIAPWIHVPEGMILPKNSHVTEEKLSSCHPLEVVRLDFTHEKSKYAVV